jgi:hypothetical protein
MMRILRALLIQGSLWAGLAVLTHEWL